MENVVIRGVSLDKNQAKLTVTAVPDQPGSASRIFNCLANGAVNVDMIVQTSPHGEGSKTTDISFTVDKPDLAKAQVRLMDLRAEIGFKDLIADEDIGKVSIVGVGMRSHSGVAARMFETLAAHQINIDMISTSEIKISVVTELHRGEDAVRAIHDAFLAS